MLVVGLGVVGINIKVAKIESNHDWCAPTTMHLFFMQRQQKMCHSPKFENGAENQFFTSWTFFFKHSEM